MSRYLQLVCRLALAIAALAVGVAALPAVAAAETAPPPPFLIGWHPDYPDLRTTWIASFRTPYIGPHRLEVTQDCEPGVTLFEGTVLPENGLVYFAVNPPLNAPNILPCPASPPLFRVYAAQPDGSEVLAVQTTAEALLGVVNTGTRLVAFVERSRRQELAGRAQYLPFDGPVSPRARITVAAAGLSPGRRYNLIARKLSGGGSGRCKRAVDRSLPTRPNAQGQILAIQGIPSKLSISGESPEHRWCRGQRYALQLNLRGTGQTVGPSTVIEIR
jgi:hypothetical protein